MTSPTHYETLWEFQLVSQKMKLSLLGRSSWRHQTGGGTMMRRVGATWSCGLIVRRNHKEKHFEVSCHILLLSFPLRVWGLFWFLKWIFFRVNLKMQYSLRFWPNFVCICLEYSWALTDAGTFTTPPDVLCVRERRTSSCWLWARGEVVLPVALCRGFPCLASCWVPLNGLQMDWGKDFLAQ